MNDDEQDSNVNSIMTAGGWCAPAQPWPGEVNTEGLAEPTLADDQEARCTALHSARVILERRGGVMMGQSASTPPPVDDLLRVAQYILTGNQS